MEREKTHLFLRNGALRGLGKLVNSLAVFAQILLTADEDNRKTLAEVQNLGDPLEYHFMSAHPVLLTPKCSVVLGFSIQNETPTFSWTLSSESGESTAKQIKMTCESGYERGRRRS